MNSAGLSLDQAPPFPVPLRFFLTAPLFGLAAAFVALSAGPAAFTSRAMPATLAATHLVTLGVATMVMAGAILQLLPVLAGSPVARPGLVAWLVHAPLVAGTALLAAAFLGTGPWAFQGALGLLAIALGTLVLATVVSLARATSAFATVLGMWLAIVALGAAATAGVLLAAGWSGHATGAFTWLRGVHPVWGLAGWIGLLIVGVAYQVVPMFQLTPPYPRWATRGLGPALFVAIVLATVAPAPVARFGAIATGLLFAAFAGLTLRLQAKRRRRLADVGLSYWRLGLASLVVACVAALGLPYVPLEATSRVELLVGVALLAGFALSIIEGMLFKIVPFLAWFHLESRWGLSVKIPHMKDLLPDRRARLQLRLHAGSVALLAAATFAPNHLYYLAFSALAASQAVLATNLAFTLRVYLAADRAGRAAATPP